MITSMLPSMTSQNKHSTQSFYNGFDSQTGRDLRGTKKEAGFHWKTTVILAPMGVYHHEDMGVSFPLEATP